MRRIAEIRYRPRRRTAWHRLRWRLRRLGIYWTNLVDVVGGVGRDLRPPPEQGTLVRLSPPASRRWCLYAAYSPTSCVSDMVLAQLRAYREAGFAVVFVSMSNAVSDADRDRLASVCCGLIHRRSFGRDFGAWAHATRLLGADLADAQSLLLTNDSQLGPIVPLAPWIDACTARDGLFGLTESLGGGSHLQSYFLLANGVRAVADVVAYLTHVRLTHSKWLMVQRGEVAFSRAMREKGHYTAAVLDHETIENALLDHPELLAELSVLEPALLEGLRPAQPLRNRYLLRSRLFMLPLNPCHQLNSVLLRHFKFPFIKVDLVTKNPGMVPSAPDWRYFIGPDSPVTEAMIDDHLATLA
ncbi:rhamnan synthesis F family protein [Blastochloris viridis]|nr:rhamnan synthesis F family protein [Blastochloris viridis]ALK08442.1 Rhamnan synthesis protein F [Blastochloris viridis]CUU41104.1 Rhamnan synthesis protein F [Blastochloris viridis]